MLPRFVEHGVLNSVELYAKLLASFLRGTHVSHFWSCSMNASLSTLVPLLQPLVSDPESIIRQHLASQLLPVAIVCMVRGIGPYSDLSVEQILQEPSTPRKFVDVGYKAVTSAIVSYLNILVQDVDNDVRRAASESLAGLASQIPRKDVCQVLVPIPVQMANDNLKPRKGMPEGFHEELRITASHLLAELAGAAESGYVPPQCVEQHIWPAVLALCRDVSFRVRRSAAQALPRVLGGVGSLALTQSSILPAFEELSNDDMYRVRKSTGECLVDMSRSLMLVAQQSSSTEEALILKTMRRAVLIPIALQLLSDANKFVRHGMMQFLGPFIASFYPLEEGALKLPGSGTAEEVVLEGIGSQFFPHASSMVSRLNASGTANTSSPTPTPATLDPPEKKLSDRQQLEQSLPEFIPSNRISFLTLSAVVQHRHETPPDAQDLASIQEELLGHFCALSTISTGDDNTDAEMRVYCAYSYPAVVLLLGAENWKGALHECFLSLVNPNHNQQEETIAPPPLPVKRCLASSLHTVAHVLGPELTVSDILPVFRSQFLLDTDDSVRLNVIRNYPWLLSLLPSTELKNEYLALWRDIVKGEDLLGAHKRSATNPMLLNWRQRDAVSKSLPDLLSFATPLQAHLHLWPILQMLLSDSVSSVREDAEWSIPLVLRAFCFENIQDDNANAKRWSADACQGVILWLKDSILGGTKKGAANFAGRQLYCRICAAVGLSLRFGDLEPEEQWDEKFRHLVVSDANAPRRYVAYQTMTNAERKHLRRLLVYDLLTPALEMKDDRVTNVRLTLMKVLQGMPEDVRELASVSEVLQELEDEVETWESFNGGPPPPPPPPRPEYRAAV